MLYEENFDLFESFMCYLLIFQSRTLVLHPLLYLGRSSRLEMWKFQRRQSSDKISTYSHFSKYKCSFCQTWKIFSSQQLKNEVKHLLHFGKTRESHGSIWCGGAVVLRFQEGYRVKYICSYSWIYSFKNLQSLFDVRKVWNTNANNLVYKDHWFQLDWDWAYLGARKPKLLVSLQVSPFILCAEIHRQGSGAVYFILLQNLGLGLKKGEDITWRYRYIEAWSQLL